MKTRIILLMFLIAFLLLSTGASALSGPRYQVEAGAISGGSCRLASFGQETERFAAGGAYRLLGPSVPNLRGSGCCCTHVPCILRDR